MVEPALAGLNHRSETVLTNTKDQAQSAVTGLLYAVTLTAAPRP